MAEQETENVQQDLEIFENQKIAEAVEEKVKWFGDKNLSFKQRLYQFIATVFVTLAKNFFGKLKWQLGLVIYLAIVCPVGTWTTLKWIFKLFF